MVNREESEQKRLEIIEDLSLLIRSRLKELPEKQEEAGAHYRLGKLEEILENERRLIEEVSLPCRFILEHFSVLMEQNEQVLNYKIGQWQEGRNSLCGFSVEKFGNIVLNMGNVVLRWRDGEYAYYFYPGKVILRSVEQTKPEIHLSFSFSFKHSHVLLKYQDLQFNEKVMYWHEDLVVEK